jgi:hypothetical protein
MDYGCGDATAELEKHRRNLNGGFRTLQDGCVMTSIIIKKLSSAMNAMRRPGARLIQTFSYYGKPDYWIAPGGGRVDSKIAEQIIAHPQVIGGEDALFPGHHQTWRMRPSE